MTAKCRALARQGLGGDGLGGEGKEEGGSIWEIAADASRLLGTAVETANCG